MATTYATVADIQARLLRTLTADETRVCGTYLEDAAAVIDTWNSEASADAKKIVSCNMIIRQLNDGQDSGIPMGATQGSMGGLGYTQSWTISSGSVGEMYLTRMDKKLLGASNRIGSYSPVEELVCGG